MNIDQLQEIEQRACKVLAIASLIRRSEKKTQILGCSRYYTTFGTAPEMLIDVAKQNQVTQRLVNYLTKLTQK